ncbi:MAG: hypothetical protein RL698_3195 [Pseudomonadota bacterium]|jgi:SAM-dependent methyltransferase
MAEAEERHWWYPATRELLRASLEPLLQPGARVLDAGCGTGSAGGWLGDRFSACGIDPEPLALDLYRRRRPGARLVRAGIEALPFAAESFDAALVVTVLYHEAVVDPQLAVRSIAATLRPGGVLCLLEPGLRRLRRGHDRVTRTARRFAPSDLRALLVGAGLEPLRVTGAYAFLVAPAWIKSILERGRSTSDLEEGGWRGDRLLAALAALERHWLARRDLPVGLSVLALARKPAG